MRSTHAVHGLVLLLTAGFGSGLAGAEEAASPFDAIAAGRPEVNLRPRYERVAQDGRPENADALTVRTLLGWRTGSWHDVSAFAQLIDVGRANDNYNDTRNGRVQFPVVSDPDDTDVNQLYIDYGGLPQTRIRLGRQSIKLDNTRFVGNVEFRQIMQVFNGVTVENRSLPKLVLQGGHLERLKTVIGDQQEIRFDLANAAYQWAEGNLLVAYGYFLD